MQFRSRLNLQTLVALVAIFSPSAGASEHRQGWTERECSRAALAKVFSFPSSERETLLARKKKLRPICMHLALLLHTLRDRPNIIASCGWQATLKEEEEEEASF